MREQFVEIENESRRLSPLLAQNYSDKRRIPKKLHDRNKVNQTLTGVDKFRIETFYVIIDKLVSELLKRSESYKFILELFGFLSNLLTIQGSAMNF